MPASAPWSSTAPMDQLVTLLTGFAGVQWVNIGVPDPFPARVGAYITLGGQRPENAASGGLVQRTMGYRVVVCYILEDAEEDAERTVAGIVDALMDALYADRTLGGTLERIEIDASEADQPRYALPGGQEAREWPLRITGAQRKTFPV